MKKTLCFIGLLVVAACSDPVISTIPSAPVYFELNLDYADSDLMPALAAKSFTQGRTTTDKLGFGGVLVVHGYSSNEAIHLFAYDLACPNEIDRNVKVVPDTEGKARCPKCGSVYITMWGTGIPEKNSVSHYPLRSYVVKSTGRNTFVVVN
ncbi:MAG: hypothetical protein LBS46_08830 [Dysgonamonadaceae bacterium]|jgi:hypothetical protein|nr:hypothetical protein [Dysgonamonadaceae bacterium]